MSSATPQGAQNLEVVPIRHYGRWLGVVAALVAVVMIVHTIFSKIPAQTGQTVCHVVNGVKVCHPLMLWRFSWDVVGQFFFTNEILQGLWLTLQLTGESMIIGVTIGVVVAIMRLSPNRVLSGTAWVYTWFFRGTPVIAQLAFWFELHLIYPQLSIGIPFLPVSFLHIDTTTLFTPYLAALVGLALNEGAYMSEIVRSGLISVDEGQIEAATSIGMTRAQTLRLVILPQAMRVTIPPTGNEVISMLKTSSIASTVSVMELFGIQGLIAGGNYEIVPLLITASLWYIIVTTVLSIGQFYLERHYARGSLRNQPLTPIQRLRRDVKGIAGKFRTPRPVLSR
jgi:polar amino acid transport system permease protein